MLSHFIGIIVQSDDLCVRLDTLHGRRPENATAFLGDRAKPVPMVGNTHWDDLKKVAPATFLKEKRIAVRRSLLLLHTIGVFDNSHLQL